MSDAPTVTDVRVRRSWLFLEPVERPERAYEAMLSGLLTLILGLTALSIAGALGDGLGATVLGTTAAALGLFGFFTEGWRRICIVDAEVSDAD